MREALPPGAGARARGSSRAAALVAVLAFAATPAWAQGKSHPISEFFVGIHHHDSGVFGRNREDGPDANVEWRFDALALGLFEPGSLLDRFLSFRPTLGVNANTQGDTTAGYLAATWTFDLTERVFFDWSMGGALHDGKISEESLTRKTLGSRVLFYLAAGIGYRFLGRHSISLRLDHISNAKLAEDNDGLDTVGIRYGYRF